MDRLCEGAEAMQRLQGWKRPSCLVERTRRISIGPVAGRKSVPSRSKARTKKPISGGCLIGAQITSFNFLNTPARRDSSRGVRDSNANLRQHARGRFGGLPRPPVGGGGGGRGRVPQN